jgi:UV DNA damage repair endonuclease
MGVGISKRTKIDISDGHGMLEADVRQFGNSNKRGAHDVKLRMFLEDGDAYEITLSPKDVLEWCDALANAVKGVDSEYQVQDA